jgi:hypothetical protein
MSTLYRMSEDELPAVLSLLAESGSTARSADSWKHDQMTALLLGKRGDFSAVMPMARRTLNVAPHRQLNVGWLSSNQFATRMSLRRQTRDTYPEWPALLSDLDALIVARRDEASLSARWYAQTGFHDVLAIRCLYLDMAAPPAPQNTTRYHPEVVSAGGISWDKERWQPEMLSVYNDVYAAAGGTVPRHENFWSSALAHHYYREHYQFQIIGLWSGAGQSVAGGGANSLMGYAVVGWSGWHSKRPRMDILELATRQWDTAVASELLHTTCQLAWSKIVHQVRAVISAHDPYRGHLARSGFVDRWGYRLLAKWLHPQRYLNNLALPGELADLSLTLSTPGNIPLTIQPRTKSGIGIETQGDPLDVLMRGKMLVPSTNSPLHLQCDPATLTRLLLQRLDITAAVQEGTLFSTSQGQLATNDLTRLSLAFPWTPWMFHMLDYI